MCSNKELKKIREDKEKEIMGKCLSIILLSEEDDNIKTQLISNMSETSLIKVIQTFSKMSSKIYDEIRVKIVHNIDEFEKHMMVDKYNKVSYQKNIIQFDTFVQQMSGSRFVSYVEGNEFEVHIPGIIADNIKILPFMSIIKVDNHITNELLFYIKEDK